MGNNNSTHDETKSPSEEKDIFEQLFYHTETMFPKSKKSEAVNKKNTTTTKDKTADDILSNQVFNRVDDMYDRLWAQKQILPDISDTNYNKQLTISSDDPHQYVEFVVCQGDLNDVNKKYPINLTKPGHHCNSDCGCIMQVLDLHGDKIDIYNDPKDDQTYSATSPDLRHILANTKSRLPSKLMFGGKKTNDEDSIFSDTSEDEKRKKKDKSKKEEDEDDIFDEPDEEDEDLEGLEEEDITEDGFLIEQSDLNSSDLYRMQRRIFVSETETPTKRSNQKYLVEPSQLTSDETTENVRNAINRLNVRNSMFNSEDRKILDLNSDTDKYYNKPAKRNTKYN